MEANSKWRRIISGEASEVKPIYTAANTTLTAEQQQIVCASLDSSKTTFLV